MSDRAAMAVTPSSSLAALEQALQAHLLHGDPEIAGALHAGGIGVARRLAIYREGYRLRLLAALKDSHGHLARWLGDEAFDPLALAWIDAHPSRCRSLNDYGAGLAGWLQQQRHAEAPVQAELARMDWALRRAFDGADSPVLTREYLAALPPEAWADAGFVPVPTWTLLEQRYNTLALWLAIDEERTPPPVQALPAPQTVIVWRKQLQPHFRSIAADECEALRMLHGGASFAAVCEHMAGPDTERAQEVAQTAGRWLQRWLEEELLGAMTRR